MEITIKFHSVKEMIATHKFRGNLYDELERIGFEGKSTGYSHSDGVHIERKSVYRGTLKEKNE